MHKTITIIDKTPFLIDIITTFLDYFFAGTQMTIDSFRWACVLSLYMQLRTNKN